MYQCNISLNNLTPISTELVKKVPLFFFSIVIPSTRYDCKTSLLLGRVYLFIYTSIHYTIYITAAAAILQMFQNAIKYVLSIFFLFRCESSYLSLTIVLK